MIIKAFIIGLSIGFIFYEMTDISAGGVIAPAYFATFINEPNRIIITIVIAFVVFIILKILMSRFIIYGRRRLFLALLLGFALKLLLENIIQPMPNIVLDLRSIGYLIPGLIANEMVRQKIVPTLAGLGIVTILIYFVLLII